MTDGKITKKESMAFLMLEKDPGRAVAFRLACERLGGKIFDFGSIEGLDYFIKDLAPQYFLINAIQFEQEIPLLLAMSREAGLKVIIYGERNPVMDQLLKDWANQVEVEFENFPINPLKFFKKLLHQGEA